MKLCSRTTDQIRRARYVFSPDGELLLRLPEEVTKKGHRNQNAQKGQPMPQIGISSEDQGEVYRRNKRTVRQPAHSALDFGGPHTHADARQ